MTVSSTTSKSGVYSGNGVTTNFAVLFKYFAKADVDVIVTSSAGVETTKTLDTHYTLTVPGDTGTVSFITTPTDFRPQTGETVTIVRTMAMIQDMDLTSGGGLSANTVEANADTQLMQIQEIAERVSRAPLLRQTSAAAPITLPEPVALNLLSWNAAGTDLENKVAADLDIGLVSPFMLTLLDDLTAAAARTTLGVAIGTDVQAWDAQLDEWATVDPSENGKSLVSAADYAAMRALLDLEAGTDFYSIAAADSAFLSPAEGNAAYQPLDSDLTAIAALTTAAAGRSFLTIADPNADVMYFWDDSAGVFVGLTLAAGIEISGTTLRVLESFVIAASDETTAITATTNKIKFRMPYAFTLTGVKASLSTAQTSGSIFTVDINETATTILSTKLTIDNTEQTSVTAATAAVISDTALAADAEISIDVDQIGDGTAKGLKVVLLGYRP